MSAKRHSFSAALCVQAGLGHEGAGVAKLRGECVFALLVFLVG